MSIRTFFRYIIVVSVIFFGCSTQKNTRVSRGYHNLTAIFNVLFNGNESFRSGVEKVATSQVDDYSALLPMFEFSNHENLAAATSEMDRAILKGTLLIHKHSITKKPKRKGDSSDEAYRVFYNQKEFNKYVDDAYVLIGKAQFYKKDFNAAINTFDMVIRDYSSLPTSYEAIIWKALAFTELKDYANARLTLESYDLSGQATESLYGFFNAASANLLIQEKNLQAAIPFLRSAIDASPKKRVRLRYMFVLAQLLEMEGRNTESAVLFKKIVHMNPPYEMAFHSRVGYISAMSNELGINEVKKQLNRLIRDKKNIDYRDRLYYTLAKVYQDENDETETINNLKLSVKASTINTKQKSLSFLELGSIYFKKPNYKASYLAYDSAMVYLNTEDDKFKSIDELHKNLSDLVKRLDIIERNDSLISLALMPDNMRLNKLDAMVEADAKRRKDLEKKTEGYDSNDPFFMQNNYNNTFTQTSESGKWYFYNLSTVANGKMEFERIWGRRKLEDNWRRSNKALVSENSDSEFPDELGGFGEIPTIDNSVNDPTDESKPGSKADESKPLTREELMKDIPLTAIARETMNKGIETALFESGVIYHERFNDLSLAASTLENLLNRYPKGEKHEPTLMELYRVYEQVNDAAQMARVKQMYLALYPNSKFASYLNDPQFYEKQNALLKKQEKNYAQTYSNYLLGNHSLVIESAKLVEQTEPENKLLPKYRLIKALAFAREGDAIEFQTSLEDLLKINVNTPEAEYAKQYLQLLKDGRIPVKSVASQSLFQNDALSGLIAENEADTESTEFSPSIVGEHSLLIWINENSDIKRLLYNLADYNFGQFLMNDYEIKVLPLPDKSKVVEIKGFAKASEALDYFYALREQSNLFEVDNLTDAKLCVVNQKNVNLIVSSGDIKNYLPFFVKTYLRISSKNNGDEPLSESELNGELIPSKPVVKLNNSNSSESLNNNQATSYSKIEKPYWVLLIYEGSRIDHKMLKSMFEGLNRNSFNKLNIKIELSETSDKKRVLTAKSFSSIADADRYIAEIKASSFMLREVKAKPFELLIIDEPNYLLFMQNGNIEDFKLKQTSN